jgi:hypothetical protein
MKEKKKDYMGIRGKGRRKKACLSATLALAL